MPFGAKRRKNRAQLMCDIATATSWGTHTLHLDWPFGLAFCNPVYWMSPFTHRRFW